jgi:hypothetical protein
MEKTLRMECHTDRWQGRSAYLVANDRIALRFLSGGGHLASLSCRTGIAKDVNLLWEANWRTIDPQSYSARTHARTYGAPPVGQFLSGFTGHALCLDYFGAPSDEETRLGLPLHGEPASSQWTVARKSTARGHTQLIVRTKAKATDLEVQRDILLRKGETVAYVTETVANLQHRDRFLQWVQHATFGPPFLEPGESVCAISGKRAKTWPLGYEGKCALEDDREFEWPIAPAECGGFVDISQPFVREGRGFVAAVLLNRNSRFAFVAVLNWRLGLVAGYCFRTADFPWVAIWEENRVRAGAPWSGKTRARGLEFGTSPMPVGLRDSISAGPLFGTPTVRCLPANSRHKISYAIFISAVPTKWRGISAVDVEDGAIRLTGAALEDRIGIAASGLEEIEFDGKS